MDRPPSFCELSLVYLLPVELNPAITPNWAKLGNSGGQVRLFWSVASIFQRL